MTRHPVTYAIRIAVVAAALSSLGAPALAQGATSASMRSAHAARLRQANAAYVGSADPFWPGNVATPGVSYNTESTQAGAPDGAGFASDGFGGSVVYDGAPDYHGAGFNNGRFSPLYAARNNFACQPGTLFTGQDGRRHVCQ